MFNDARHDVLAIAADEDLSANALFGVGKLECRPVPPEPEPAINWYAKERMRKQGVPVNETKIRHQPLRIALTQHQMDRSLVGEHSERDLVGNEGYGPINWGWDSHSQR